MNYIYDVYLNLNNTLYDFFDWNKSDKLIHVKRIPIFKISEENFIKIMTYNIKINDYLLNNIFGKTELWNISNKIDYCALFCDNNNIIAIEFNENGISNKRSFLMIDEELEILETINKLNEKTIDFEITDKINHSLKTRNQINEENFIKKELKNMETNKLNYIYFECFGKHEKSRKTILDNINKLSINSKIYKNLYDILKLTSTTKNKML